MSKEEIQSGRRGFLKFSALTFGVATVGSTLGANSHIQNEKSVYGGYKRSKVGTLKELKKSGEIDFAYPDDSSLCKAVLVEGKPMAYSVICTHKGCPTMYDKESGIFTCPCHLTKYDARKKGQMIIGQATGRLPAIVLEVEGDNIYAIGVDGLIFGRINNTVS